jgi:hypothetical protein
MPILAMVRYRNIYRKMDFKGCVNALMESSVLSMTLLCSTYIWSVGLRLGESNGVLKKRKPNTDLLQL